MIYGREMWMYSKLTLAAAVTAFLYLPMRGTGMVILGEISVWGKTRVKVRPWSLRRWTSSTKGLNDIARFVQPKRFRRRCRGWVAIFKGRWSSREAVLRDG